MITRETFKEDPKEAAFPCPATDQHWDQPGISTHTYVCVAAMQGLLARPDGPTDHNEVAKQACSYAEALLHEINT